MKQEANKQDPLAAAAVPTPGAPQPQPELDRRGIRLPAKALVGGIITPQ